LFRDADRSKFLYLKLEHYFRARPILIPGSGRMQNEIFAARFFAKSNLLEKAERFLGGLSVLSY
jgi:hypothetical protein